MSISTITTTTWIQLKPIIKDKIRIKDLQVQISDQDLKEAYATLGVVAVVEVLVLVAIVEDQNLVLTPAAAVLAVHDTPTDKVSRRYY
jgi:hypothetical protein